MPTIHPPRPSFRQQEPVGTPQKIARKPVGSNGAARTQAAAGKQIQNKEATIVSVTEFNRSGSFSSQEGQGALSPAQSLRPAGFAHASKFRTGLGDDEWRSGVGQRATLDEAMTFIKDAKSLHEDLKLAQELAKAQKWPSKIVGSMVGLLVSVMGRPIMVNGSLYGSKVAGAQQGGSAAVLKGVLKKNNPSADRVNTSKQDFRDTLGAVMRGAAYDKSMARALDANEGFKTAVRSMHEHYKGDAIHSSLLDAFHDSVEERRSKTLFVDPHVRTDPQDYRHNRT